MKIFLGITLLITSTLLGYFLSLKYKNKKRFYSDFFDFNLKLKKEVAFSQYTIIELIDKTSKTKTSDFNASLDNIIVKNSSKINISYLSESEVDFFKNYCANIGSVDKTSQIEYLTIIQNEIEIKKTQAYLDEKKYCSLYIKLGFLLGLIALIILL